MTREIGISRLTGVVKRHKVAVGLTTALALAAGLFWVKQQPYTYEARAVVRIDDPRPSREYVPPTVSEPGVERLKSARRALIARPVVEAAAIAAGFIGEGATEEQKGMIIGSLASRLDARQEGDDTFVLKFEDADPARAQKFLAAVSKAYVDHRSKEMASRAQSTAQFFDAEVAALRPRVAEAEAVVEKFRLAHYGALPDQLEGNLRMLDETQMALTTQQNALDSALNRRRAIKAEAISPIRRQEEDVMRQLSAARVRYAEGAPEIAQLEKELARVRADRVADEEQLDKKVDRSPELRAVEEEIARARASIEQLTVRRDELQKRVAAVAKNGEELAKLALDRDVLRERLKSLVAKHEDAALAAGLEAGVAGASRVFLVEPAWVSAGPTKPSKPLFAMIALVIAIALGLGVGLLLDLVAGRIRTADDLRAMTGDVPVLGSVPTLRVVSSAKANTCSKGAL